jgi:undecaprenyl-diphosphatase
VGYPVGQRGHGMSLTQIAIVIALGIIEGITEWLPISSTGHMLLFDNVLTIDASAQFKSMFFVVIQLGAILAVVILYWNKLWPVGREVKGRLTWKKDTLVLWLKTIVAIIPSGIVGLLFDDWMDEHLHTPLVIAIALIVYGVLFIVIERWNKSRTPITRSTDNITLHLALYIGLFQVLSLVPGTSRSGATIMGALLLGLDRTTAAEFCFFMGIPTMAGASLIKLLKFGFNFSSTELMILGLGTLTAFLVSLAVIKFLMAYIKKRDFTLFGIYRIVLGSVILLLL